MRSRMPARAGLIRACLVAGAVSLVAGFGAAGAAAAPAPAPAEPPASARLRDARLYVDPSSAAKRQVQAWRASRPNEARLLDRAVASQPTAVWFGDWDRDVTAAVDRVVSDAARQGALPVLVAYNIPQRDCGSHSSGGARNADAYRDWLRRFARGLENRSAIVVLEPDALASTRCLSESGRAERFALLRQAVEILGAASALVYIDAGHANWLSAGDAAARLKQAGIEGAAGFSLNVSNFVSNAANIGYGEEVSRRTGGAHFVIDTSRNGAGAPADAAWCNPAGRALGTRPTTRTSHARLDALLWIKKPGESDGRCNGGPAAGQWWAEYALKLAERSTTQMAMADARR